MSGGSSPRRPLEQILPWVLAEALLEETARLLVAAVRMSWCSTAAGSLPLSLSVATVAVVAPATTATTCTSA